MAAQEQGRFAWMLDNERFADMAILLAIPEMMHEAANLRDTSTQRPAKRARVSRAKKPAEQKEAQQQDNKEPWFEFLQQQGIAIKASKVVLASASEYFRRRLDGWDNDPWTIAAADGKLLLVVGVEERLMQAAQAVIRLMYQEVVPASAGPLQLAETDTRPPATASDHLVVDSEDSVAVAIGWWLQGAEGSKCKNAQLKELSGLVRVKHLTAGFRLVALRKLPWFKFNEGHLDWLNIALSNGVLSGVPVKFPDAWVGHPRRQLDASELKRRCTITMDVPKAALQASLSGGPLQHVSSPSIYVAGTGLQLTLKPKAREDGAVTYGVFLRTSNYSQHGTTLCTSANAFSCNYETLRLDPSKARMRRVCGGTLTLDSFNWGRPAVIVASSPADLEPYLVDGHLKLKATVSMIPAYTAGSSNTLLAVEAAGIAS